MSSPPGAPGPESLPYSAPARERPQVIAHRGASGYLPENTLEAFALAHALGADAIELDLMRSRDGVLVACHDLTLEDTTDVRERFPGRARPDGRWYALDLDVEELKRLSVRERYATRFRRDSAGFQIPTLLEVVQLVTELNRSRGRRVELYLELKDPSFHRQAGRPLEEALVEALGSGDAAGSAPPVTVVCEEAASLRRLRFELGAGYALLQLIDAPPEYDSLATPAGLDAIASYADAIGPEKGRIEATGASAVEAGRLVQDAHARGLEVYPFTFRADQGGPEPVDFEAELRRFLFTYRVDGVFTDFPDRTLALLDSR